jgi:nicotinamide riboside transporter PnuC
VLWRGKMERKLSNERIIMLILIALTAVGITISGIVSGQDFLRLAPLYVSLSVMLFQSEARRIAPLIGGLNSILYAIVDYSYGLYASAVSDIVFSCSLQLITFVLWTKRKDGSTTIFRKLTAGKRLLLLLAVASIYAVTLAVNIKIGATMPYFDAYQLVGAFVTQGLMMFAFLEYTVFSVFGCILTVIMNALMLESSPDRLGYLVYSIYSVICAVRGAFSVARIYRIQNSKINKNEVETK